MTVRSILVRLRGENGDLNRALLGSAAAAKVLDTNLGNADGNARKLSDSLNVSNERTTMLVQGALALGPAFVPVGAQAIPLVMGLTTQLTFAAGAAGVTALAFSGIGDALEAVNEYALDPTEAHLQKLNEELSKIGPAGRDFVMYLQELRPQLQVLQDIAQAGLLPGAQEGIEELMAMLPQVERIVANISETLGDLAAEGGDSLAGPEWFDFFNYLETQAQPMLVEFSRTVGNLIQGVANLIVAFDPLNRDFSTGFLKFAREFEEWTDNLPETEGFQSFVDYIRATGPQVWETLGSLSLALIEVLKAAAPVGDVVLPMLEVLADALTAIMASPAGPTLIAVAAGLSAVSRAVALYQMANGTALVSMLGSLGVQGGKAAIGARAAGVGIGALGLALSDLDDKAGMSNTLMLGVLGAMAGPWGAAIGATAGAIMDVAAANDDMISSLDRARAALDSDTTTWQQQGREVAAAREELEKLRTMHDEWWSFVKPTVWKDSWEGVFGKSDIEEAEDALGDLEGEWADNIDAAGRHRDAIDKNSDGIIDNTDAIHDNISAMQQLRAERLLALGGEIAYEAAVDAVDERLADRKSILADIAEVERDGAEERARLERDLADADSAEGRRAVRERIADSYADQADRIADLRERLEEFKLTLDLGTESGRANAEVIKGIAETWNQLTPDQQNAPGAWRRVQREVSETVRAFGGGKKDVQEFLDLLAIPPKFEAKIDADVSEAMAKIDLLNARLNFVTRPRRSRISLALAYDAAGFDPLGGLQEKDGGIVKFYAKGGLRPREDHVAQIAPAGAYRVWAEQETGGEAYIPLADSKRARSLEIWRQTGQLLGVTFAEYANGAISAASGRFGGSAMPAAAAIDYDRLAGAMLSARPLYGDVHLHGDNSFRREMEQDARNAAVGGTRRPRR